MKLSQLCDLVIFLASFLFVFFFFFCSFHIFLTEVANSQHQKKSIIVYSFHILFENLQNIYKISNMFWNHLCLLVRRFYKRCITGKNLLNSLICIDNWKEFAIFYVESNSLMYVFT